MGLRFRKSVKVLPGVRLNFSRSGVSTSIGGKGATLNVSKKGARTTVGLPGTGISYVGRRRAWGRRAKASEPVEDSRGSRLLDVLLVCLVAVLLLFNLLV